MTPTVLKDFAERSRESIRLVVRRKNDRESHALRSAAYRKLNAPLTRFLAVVRISRDSPVTRLDRSDQAWYSTRLSLKPKKRGDGRNPTGLSSAIRTRLFVRRFFFLGDARRRSCDRSKSSHRGDLILLEWWLPNVRRMPSIPVNRQGPETQRGHVARRDPRAGGRTDSRFHPPLIFSARLLSFPPASYRSLPASYWVSRFPPFAEPRGTLRRPHRHVDSHVSAPAGSMAPRASCSVGFLAPAAMRHRSRLHVPVLAVSAPGSAL